MKFCKICNTNTIHKKGTFKCKVSNNELFELTTSTNDALKNLSNGFNQFALTEQGFSIDSETPIDYVQSNSGKSTIAELFASSIRALRCTECGHLIQLSRLP